MACSLRSEWALCAVIRTCTISDGGERRCLAKEEPAAYPSPACAAIHRFTGAGLVTAGGVSSPMGLPRPGLHTLQASASQSSPQM